MGKGETTRRSRRVVRGAPKKPASHTRSFPCPDDLWDDVERFASERGLGAPAAAARLLLRSGLQVERRVRELQAARDWQIARAWNEVQVIARGDRGSGDWDEIGQAAEGARARLRERKAAHRRREADA